MRPWEVWDQPGIREEVEAFWTSPAEQKHRAGLASIVASLVRPEARILEVGCGTGEVYALLKNYDYLGVDNSLRMLEGARAKFPEGDFRPGDAFALEFADDAFDLACAFEVFGHIPDCREPIHELCRVAPVALFTLWLGEREEPFADHYLYSLGWVRKAVEGLGRLTVVETPITTAFIVRRSA